MKRGGTIDGLAGELASLFTVETPALKERWESLYGKVPPSHVSRNLLIRAIAYRIQERALGGLKPRTQRLLARQGDNAHVGCPTEAMVRPKLKPGTRLVREWRGTLHHVVVLQESVLFRGRHYGSLSEVARVITGSRWSGPRFFGLDARAAEQPGAKL